MSNSNFKIIFSCAFFLFLFNQNKSLAKSHETKTDYQQVHDAVEDYVLGIYNVEPHRIERSVDTLLHKIGYYANNGEVFSHIPMTYQVLYDLSGKWNAKGDKVKDDSPKKIEIYDVNDKTASAKLTAEWGIDFMHLSKTDGQWKIMNIIWQSDPKKEYNHLEDVVAFQTELNNTYSDIKTSILSDKARKKFVSGGGHPFYELDEKYRIEAKLTVYENPEQIGFKTSTARIAEYNIYGKAEFELDGKRFQLLIYQSPTETEGYEDYLFLPFTDLTSGEESYGAGRYMDLRIPEDKTKIVLDFNKTYQPYCAYTKGYSCPIPPSENFIDHKIEAGIKHLELGH